MKQKKLRWGMIFVYLFIGIFGIITVFPFIYMILPKITALPYTFFQKFGLIVKLPF